MNVLVTGAAGFLGRHVTRRLEARGHVWRGVRVEKLADILSVYDADAVLHLAKPASDGIGTMAATPYTFAARCLALDQQVIAACAAARPQPKLVCLGSVCAYPESAPIPTPETALWDGYPEAVNAPYGIAKRTQLMLLQAARRETGLNGIHLILANVYGPGDRSGHVVPATIRKVRAAVMDPTAEVRVWGVPHATRSFLYVADAAEGIVRALEGYDRPEPLNLAPEQDVSMIDLVQLVADLLQFVDADRVSFDPTRPVGQRRRKYDLTALRAALGWRPTWGLYEGLRETVAWLQAEEPEGVARG